MEFDEDHSSTIEENPVLEPALSIIAKEADDVPVLLAGEDAERNLIPATEIMLADQLLRLWLTTADQAEAQKLLATLITEQAEPVVKNIVSYKLRTAAGYGRMLEDAEDLCSENGGVTLSTKKLIEICIAGQREHNLVVDVA